MNEEILWEKMDQLTRAMEAQAQAQAESNKVVRELAEATHAVLNVLVNALTEDSVDDAGMGEVLEYLDGTKR